MSNPSQNNLNLIYRNVKSSSNLRRGMNSISKKSTYFTTKCEQSNKVKFKQIIDLDSSKTLQRQGGNQLQNKYNIYKHGSPNFYSYNIQSHKANNIRNQIQSLDLPFIQSVIKQLKCNQKGQNNANLRDYNLYPNQSKEHQTHKFKELLSDKQELKDFVKWFQMSYKIIEQKDVSFAKKFRQKQIMIATGFGEITQQVARLSKPRSQILKMLWNKQNDEVQEIVQNLTYKAIALEKQHLLDLSQTHEQYQQQISSLKKQNSEFERKLSQQLFVNQGYVNTLRCDRKIIKKHEILIKKLLESNQNLTQQNLNLLDQNTKLIMASQQNNRKSTEFQTSLKSRRNQRKTFCTPFRPLYASWLQADKQLIFSQARVLNYRRLQIASKKKQSSKTIRNVKKNVLNAIKRQSEKQLEQEPFSASQEQLQQKKASLYKYLKQRFEKNPYQKLYLRDQYFHEDDHNFKTDCIQSAMKMIINSKQVQTFLKNETNPPEYALRDFGVNTTNIQIHKLSNNQFQI